MSLRSELGVGETAIAGIWPRTWGGWQKRTDQEQCPHVVLLASSSFVCSVVRSVKSSCVRLTEFRVA